MVQPTNKRLITEASLAQALISGSGGTTAPVPSIPPAPDDPPIIDPTVTPPPGGAVIPAAPTAPTVTTRTINVTTSTQLRAALADLHMGDVVNVAAGTYSVSDRQSNVPTITNSSGGAYTADARYFITTPVGLSSMTPAQARAAMPRIIGAAGNTTILNNSAGTGPGYTLFLFQAHYVWLENLVIRSGEKGFMAHNTSFTIALNCRVENVGNEGWHYRNLSSNNLAYNCTVATSGLTSAGTGEAFYIGMSESSRTASYSMISATGLDTSDNNKLIGCAASDFTSEAFDIKEMTTGNYIGWCTANGGSISGANNADGYVDVKGNNTIVEYNVFTNPSSFVLNAMETHILLAGWGNNNIFRGNSGPAGSQATSYFINVQLTGSRGNATGNIVYSSNTASPASSAPAGLTNIPVTPDGTVVVPGNSATTPRSWLNPFWEVQLPVSDGGTGILAVKEPQLDTYTSTWFSSTSTYLEEYVDATGAHSSGSLYPRTELREMNADGTIAGWSTSVGYHTFSARIALMELTANKKRVILAQVHYGGSDLVTLRTDSDGAGGIQIAFWHEDIESVLVVAHYTLTTEMVVQFVVWQGKIYCYLDGVWKATFTDTQNTTTNYFKTGAYFLTYTGLVFSGGAPEPSTSHTKTHTLALQIAHAASAPVFVPGPNTSDPFVGLPPGDVVSVTKGASWPVRPTSRADIVVLWIGPDPAPSIGGTGMVDNVDLRLVI